MHIPIVFLLRKAENRLRYVYFFGLVAFFLAFKKKKLGIVLNMQQIRIFMQIRLDFCKKKCIIKHMAYNCLVI